MTAIALVAAGLTVASPPSDPTLDANQAKVISRQAHAEFAMKRWKKGIEILVDLYERRPNRRYLYSIAFAFERVPGGCAKAVEYYDRFMEACGRCGYHARAKERRTLVAYGCPVLESASTVDAARAKRLSQEVLVEGWGELRLGRVAARDAALRDALQSAVAQVAGLHISVASIDRMYSSLQGGREEFTQKVRQRITSNYRGFVDSYRVVERTTEDGLVKVLVQVKVRGERIIDNVREVAKRLAEARFPKLLLDVEETYVGQDGRKKTVESSVLHTILEKALLERGFELVADASAAAEYVVKARAQVSHRRFEHGHFGDVRLDLRAIAPSTGQVVSRAEEAGPTPPAARTEDFMREQGIRRLAPSIVEQFIEQFLDHILRDRIYIVRLTNLSSYVDEGRPFIAAIKALPGVGQVGTRMKSSRLVEVEVRFPTQLDDNTLVERIIDQARKSKSLRSIDLAESAAGELNFRLRR